MSLDQNQNIKNVKIFKNLGIDTICISPKTFNEFLCIKDKHVINKIIFFNGNDDKMFIDKLILDQGNRYINKIKINNINYLFLSNSNLLYKINDNNQNKIFNINNTFLKSCFGNENIRYLIALDNKNIVANVDSSKLGFYNFVNSKYEKFFNNLNKYYQIYGILKLENNEFCFLSSKNNYDSNLIISKFNEDFYSAEKNLKEIACNEKNLSNLVFKISKSYIVIVGSNNFVLFNINTFEISTIIETDNIISSLKINTKNLNREEFEYMALITEKNKSYYLQIYKFNNNAIKGVNEIKLIDYSEKEEINIQEDDNNKRKIKKYNLLNNEDLTEYFLKSKFDFIGELDITFDINYDIKNNGNIIFIFGINFFSLNKRLVAIFEVNLDNLEYK